jgi:protein-tyrosine phosphatase
MLNFRGATLGLELTVSSAGTRARNGHPIHPESRRVLLERGIDSDDFESRLLTERIVARQDLVLGMTREHRSASQQLAPMKWKRIVTVREVPALPAIDSAADPQVRSARIDPNVESLDIVDPIGQPPEVFDMVAAEIEQAIERLIGWLVRNSGTSDSRPWAAQ